MGGGSTVRILAVAVPFRTPRTTALVRYCVGLVAFLTHVFDTAGSNNFLRFFQRDQLLLLLTEEMFAGTIDMMNRIQSFLGLPFFDYT